MIKKILLLLFLCATSALHAANYLTFTAKADSSSFGIFNVGGNDPDVQYSLDGGKTWERLKNNTLIDLPNKKKALLRGYNPQGISKTYGENTCFVITGRIAASGSVMSLIDGKGETTVIPNDYCFYHLFSRCESLTQTPQLPATTLAKDCYSGMFVGCTSLTQAPKLPATKLADYCYSGMFTECTNLTKAPELPATQLTKGCYFGMFWGCTSLAQAPKLPATKLAGHCYAYMFTECTNLTKAPELPARALAKNCYDRMFSGCTNLTQAPQLPAEKLATECYTEMFKGCTNLTQAPQLPAKKLATECYTEMFSGCTNLVEINVGFTKWNEEYRFEVIEREEEHRMDGESSSSTSNWLSGVAPNGTFICPKELPKKSGESRIPEGWKVIEN